MSVYFSVRITIHDNDEYEKYLAECDSVFARYRGEYLAVDSSPLLLEGSRNCTRAVIIRFDHEYDFNQWYYSDDYQKILPHRLKGAECEAFLVRGKQTRKPAGTCI